MMNVLVVGGAGYIGSHCVRKLEQNGYRPVVLDNLVYGHRAALPGYVPFYEGDLGDKSLVVNVLKEESIHCVMHFAAYAFVGESVQNPLKYYENNVVATLRLLEAMLDCGVKKFIFSSSCATYGAVESLPIIEDTLQKPINPYGQTKLDVECLLKFLANAYGLSFAAFRYFNAAGASETADIGEDHRPEPHLIPSICEVLLGKRDKILIFGDDYDTPDGTCLRDYIHVDDLSEAHILALSHLNEPGQSLFFNLGTGCPYSVKAVIAAVEKISGQKVSFEVDSRRPGDPPALYADAKKAKTILGWQPHYVTIESIVKTAWAWHKRHPDGY
jgi:UDP-glucose 4-epimerase